jgi:hypothetical protein
MYDMPTKTSNKSNDLVSVLQSHLGGKINLARINQFDVSSRAEKFVNSELSDY